MPGWHLEEMAVGYPTPQILGGGAIGEERCVHPCCLTWEFIPTVHGCPWHLAQCTHSWHVPIHTPVPFFSLVFSLSLFFFPISNQNKNKNAPSFMKLPEKHSRMELGCQGLQDAYQPLVQFCSLQPTWGEAKGGKLGWVPIRATWVTFAGKHVMAGTAFHRESQKPILPGTWIPCAASHWSWEHL